MLYMFRLCSGSLNLPRQPGCFQLIITAYKNMRITCSFKNAGYERRLFMAEMTLKYCEGNARKAETVFGWNRNSIVGQIR